MPWLMAGSEWTQAPTTATPSEPSPVLAGHERALAEGPSEAAEPAWL